MTEIQLAYQAIDLCRMQLFLQHRFLETALYRLPLEERDTLEIMGTDGQVYYYQAVGCLKKYLEAPESAEKIFLHMVLHCVFQHPFQTGREEGYWNLAADIAAAAVMKEFGCSLSDQEERILQRLEQSLTCLSAQVIFRYLQQTDARKNGVCGVSLEKTAALFRLDDHSLWAAGNRSSQKWKTGNTQKADKNSERESENEAGEDRDEETEAGTGGDRDKKVEAGGGKEQDEEAETGTGDDQGGESETGSGEDRDGESEAGSGEDQDGESEGGAAHMQRLEELRREWKDVAERMDMELQSFAAMQGNKAGHLLQNLREVERDRIDYVDFLRKFAVLRETMQLDMDEFDYIFYTYGLNLYGNVPLVEPLEYKETYQIHDFVIAIDTSGSCSGEIVQRFLQKTFSILKETESYDKRVNIHLVQCDCEIQKVDVINTLEELDRYLEGLELHGFGGTDFRPVFIYIEEQIRKHAFSRLEGMIYFTDGYGIFPSRLPRYRTVFAFVDQQEIPPVPPWAMRVIWDEEDFREYEY